jgi:hypothetical protein
LKDAGVEMRKKEITGEGNQESSCTVISVYIESKPISTGRNLRNLCFEITLFGVGTNL